jgi:hypothetical protein
MGSTARQPEVVKAATVAERPLSVNRPCQTTAGPPRPAIQGRGCPFGDPPAAICEVCQRRKRRHRAQRGCLPQRRRSASRISCRRWGGRPAGHGAPRCEASGHDVPDTPGGTGSRDPIARWSPADIAQATVTPSLIAPLTFPPVEVPAYVVSVVGRRRVVRLAVTGTSITCPPRQTPTTMGSDNTNLT